MGEASELALGWGRHFFTIAFALITLVLQVFVPYHRYVRYLKWLTFALFAYLGVVFTLHVPWREVALRMLLPHFALGNDAATMIVAVFGTTISPYLFFWQASEEVEEISRRPGAHPLYDAPEEAPDELRRIGWDTYLGMGYSNLIAYFIILSTALTLHRAGINDIQTAAQAASALRPIAGDVAFGLFAAGIIGTGLLAVPTLGGSAAYALSEAMGWREGLETNFSESHGFYGVIGLAIAAGVALDFSPIDPMKALFWSAVVNGVIAVPLMFIVMLLVTSRRVMDEFTATVWQRWGGWLATAIMAAVSTLMFVLA